MSVQHPPTPRPLSSFPFASTVFSLIPAPLRSSCGRVSRDHPGETLTCYFSLPERRCPGHGRCQVQFPERLGPHTWWFLLLSPLVQGDASGPPRLWPLLMDALGSSTTPCSLGTDHGASNPLLAPAAFAVVLHEPSAGRSKGMLSRVVSPRCPGQGAVGQLSRGPAFLFLPPCTAVQPLAAPVERRASRRPPAATLPPACELGPRHFLITSRWAFCHFSR